MIHIPRSIARRLAAALVSALFAAAPAHALAQDDAVPPLLGPLDGAVVLAGGGPVPSPVYECVARLAGGGGARLVIVGGRAKPPQMARWRALGVRAVTMSVLKSKAQLRAEKTLLPFLDATGVWLADDVPGLRGSQTFQRILHAVLARGGVVGGNGAGARELATRSGKKGGFDVFPRSVVSVGYRGERDDDALRKRLGAHPGLVGWGIPEGAALVVHRGRRVCAIGKGTVIAQVAARNGWSAHTERVGTGPYAERWDELPYAADLLVLARMARVRCGPVFPPKDPPKPAVAKGTLLLGGGRRVTDAIWKRFIDAAGGKKATFVCIPTAGSQGEQSRKSFSAGELRERGCKNVHVLHTRSRDKADLDAPFRAALDDADGVWIDGGRTYKVMDVFQETAVHRGLEAVLARGGVVAGSSAGCQVQGDFLMRGNPSGNKILWQDGYQHGFGLLRGVIIDAHFRQRRDRAKNFLKVMKRFPQMLGVGVDENTALIVKGSIGEVLGENAVTFLDYGGQKPKTVQLEAGGRYDLAARRVIKP